MKVFSDSHKLSAIGDGIFNISCCVFVVGVWHFSTQLGKTHHSVNSIFNKTFAPFPSPASPQSTCELLTLFNFRAGSEEIFSLTPFFRPESCEECEWNCGSEIEKKRRKKSVDSTDPTCMWEGRRFSRVGPECSSRRQPANGGGLKSRRRKINSKRESEEKEGSKTCYWRRTHTLEYCCVA